MAEMGVNMKKTHDIAGLETAADAPENPFDLFAPWLVEAERGEPSDFNAMTLATINTHGRPESRVVLLKNFDERGFVFYTNRESAKARAIAAHPFAALCFHWKSMDAQVRIEGAVEPVSDTESEAYFQTRPRGSRLGAWASRQSQELETRAALAARVAEFDKNFSGSNIPRPPPLGRLPRKAGAPGVLA